MARVFTDTRTVANGAKFSDRFDAGNYTGGTFQLPSAITGTEIKLQMSNDGSTWTDVVAGDGEANPITVSVSGTYIIPRGTFNALYGRFYFTDTQLAERTISVALKA